MCAVRMPQARRADLAVEQRVVDRVKHAVAHTGDDRTAGQHPVSGAQRITKSRQADQTQTQKQNWPRTEPVHRKARQRLHHTRHDKENRHQPAQLDIADRKLALQPGKQRRQQQLAEVADQVRRAHQADNARVLPK
jgi:hypothetical protein